MISKFGLIIIGDELLFGNRNDQHQMQFRNLLARHDMQLKRCWLLPDDTESLISHLTFSMSEELPVFVCGGIGATPDDLTRACAAEASGVPLERHKEAQKLIEERFGDEAYPVRILMADLPRGCELIPNPYNQIPGFTINRHHFLPGFPEMAWPMAEWVLENNYPPSHSTLRERSLRVLNTPESRLVSLMEEMNSRYPNLSLFSLPQLGSEGSIELGIRGEGNIDDAFAALEEALHDRNIPFLISN